jgi:hypothetical protein
MMLYAVHFLFCNFIGENVCCSVNLHCVAIDDLASERFGKVNAQLRFADSC